MVPGSVRTSAAGLDVSGLNMADSNPPAVSGLEPGKHKAGPARAAPPRFDTPHRQAYAAIDLGTNNCRLLIARPSGENFTVIDAFSRVVRLGEGLAQSGRLSDVAMDRALAALGVCADKLIRRKVHLARSVATEACRRAENGVEFIERVRTRDRHRARHHQRARGGAAGGARLPRAARARAKARR